MDSSTRNPLNKEKAIQYLQSKRKEIDKRMFELEMQFALLENEKKEMGDTLHAINHRLNIFKLEYK